MCSAVQMLTLCLRSFGCSYLWLHSTTFLCVFPPLLWDPSQFMISVYWINWQQSRFQFIFFAVTYLFISFYSGRWPVPSAEMQRTGGVGAAVATPWRGLSCQDSVLKVSICKHGQFSHHLILTVKFSHFRLPPC